MELRQYKHKLKPHPPCPFIKSIPLAPFPSAGSGQALYERKGEENDEMGGLETRPYAEMVIGAKIGIATPSAVAEWLAMTGNGGWIPTYVGMVVNRKKGEVLNLPLQGY